jgi:hypothetical protein
VGLPLLLLLLLSMWVCHCCCCCCCIRWLQVPIKSVAGLLTSKLLLHPLIGLTGLLAALHAGLLPRDTDPLMLLVMLLVWCTPTAVLTHSLATMLQVCGGL